MKAKYWALAVAVIVVLAFVVGCGPADAIPADAEPSEPALGMADFRMVENQATLSGTGGPVTALQTGMGDLRMVEASRYAPVGFGDLRKLESDQAHASSVGIGDLRLFEAER